MITQVGTERTSVRPLDKVNARLAELKDQKSTLEEKRRKLLSIESELGELRAGKGRLNARKEALEELRKLVPLAGMLERAGRTRDALQNARNSSAALQELASVSLINSCETRSSSRTSLLRRRRRWAGRVAGLCWILAALLIVSGFAGFHPGFAAGIVPAAAVVVLMVYRQLLAMKLTRQSSGKIAVPQGGVPTHQTVRMEAARREMEQVEEELSTALRDIERYTGMIAGGVEKVRKAYLDNNEDVKEAAVLIHFLETSPETAGEEIEKVFGQAAKDYEEVLIREKELEMLLGNPSADSEELQRVEEELENLESEKSRLEDTQISLRLALEVLTECNHELRRNFSPILSERMSVIAGRITGGRYREMGVDDGLALKTAVPETGDFVDAVTLSGGTADQLYLALRLAAAGLFTEAAESLPVIMDEVFAQYDEKRTLQTLEFLKELSAERQVIFLTCRKREVDLADAVWGGCLPIIEIM